MLMLLCEHFLFELQSQRGAAALLVAGAEGRVAGATGRAPFLTEASLPG